MYVFKALWKVLTTWLGVLFVSVVTIIAALALICLFLAVLFMCLAMPGSLKASVAFVLMMLIILPYIRMLEWMESLLRKTMYNLMLSMAGLESNLNAFALSLDKNRA
jgi:hypothetical protein